MCVQIKQSELFLYSHNRSSNVPGCDLNCFLCSDVTAFLEDFLLRGQMIFVLEIRNEGLHSIFPYFHAVLF